MKAVILATSFGLALAGLPAITIAACGAPSVPVNTVAALNTLLQGNTACVPPVTQPTMIWQELHQAPNALVDYKRGPLDPVDPSKTVGTWSASGSDGRALVIYSYGNTGTSPPFNFTYTYSVWNNGDGTHSFCSANPEIIAKIKAGGGAC